jgi:hypothetical protein
MEGSWYYAKSRNREGPVSKNRLQDMLNNGELDPETLIWSETLKDWASASQVKGFQISSSKQKHNVGNNEDVESEILKQTYVSDGKKKRILIQTITQKVVLSIAAGFGILMMLFPPFKIERSKVTLNMGYAFLFNPPKSGRLTASVNIELLLIQFLILVVCGLFIWFALKSNK